MAPGRHELTFADGSTVRTDMLIGADRAWSRIRPLASYAKPAYTGMSFVEVDLFDADTRHSGPAAVHNQPSERSGGSSPCHLLMRMVSRPRFRRDR